MTFTSTTSEIILHIISLIYEHMVYTVAQERVTKLGRADDTNLDLI
jgi:hypothetical protein